LIHIFTNFVLINSCFAAFEGLTVSSEEIIFDSYNLRSYPDKFQVTLFRNWKYGLQELAVNRFHLEYFGDLIPIRAEWQSSGDKIYSENRIILGAGIRHNHNLLIIKGNIYNLNISNYGSSNNLGLDFFLKYKLFKNYIFAAGSDGLIAGSSKQQNNYICRKVWGKVTCQTDKKSYTSIMMEVFQSGEPSIALGYHHKFTKKCCYEFFFSNIPERLGINILLVLPHFSIKSGVSFQPRLGWCQRLGVSYFW